VELLLLNKNRAEEKRVGARTGVGGGDGGGTAEVAGGAPGLVVLVVGVGGPGAVRGDGERAHAVSGGSKNRVGEPASRWISSAQRTWTTGSTTPHRGSGRELARVRRRRLRLLPLPRSAASDGDGGEQAGCRVVRASRRVSRFFFLFTTTRSLIKGILLKASFLNCLNFPFIQRHCYENAFKATFLRLI